MPGITRQVVEQRQQQQNVEPEKPDKRKIVIFLLAAQVVLLCVWGSMCFLLGLFSDQIGATQKALQIWQILIS